MRLSTWSGAVDHFHIIKSTLLENPHFIDPAERVATAIENCSYYISDVLLVVFLLTAIIVESRSHLLSARVSLRTNTTATGKGTVFQLA